MDVRIAIMNVKIIMIDAIIQRFKNIFSIYSTLRDRHCQKKLRHDRIRGFSCDKRLGMDIYPVFENIWKQFCITSMCYQTQALYPSQGAAPFG